MKTRNSLASKPIVFFVSLLLSADLFASTLSYKEVKTLADKHEQSLPVAQAQDLMKAQGMVGGKALTECFDSVPGPRTIPFVLVMQLDGNGIVVHTWLDGGSDVAKCFEKKLATQKLFVPPFVPFYTSFEMQFK